MNEVLIKAVLKNTELGYVVLPVTKADDTLFKQFVGTNDKRYLTVTLKSTNSLGRSYSQIKTVWALITIIFQSLEGRKPTESEKKQFYNELLDMYADRKPSFLHKEETVPLTLTDMTARQVNSFIQTLIKILAENCELELEQQLDAKNVFCEWENYLSSLERDPNDYDDNGNEVPIPEWRKEHIISFASGLTATDEEQLDLAHIVSRGADEEHRDCSWNVMMLTHEEHMKQHELGWDNFLELYPHLRGRVERAKKQAGRKPLKEE